MDSPLKQSTFGKVEENAQDFERQNNFNSWLKLGLVQHGLGSTAGDRWHSFVLCPARGGLQLAMLAWSPASRGTSYLGTSVAVKLLEGFNKLSIRCTPLPPIFIYSHEFVDSLCQRALSRQPWLPKSHSRSLIEVSPS